VSRLPYWKKTRRPRWLRISIWSGFFLVLAILGLVSAPWIKGTAFPRFMELFGSGTQNGPAHTFAESNCQFRYPGKPWQPDNSQRFFGAAHLALFTRADPNAWMALSARDYQTRTPRAGELVDETVVRLNSQFKNLEWELKPDEELAGHSARHMFFQGEVNNVRMVGDCYMFADKGIAYWFTTWTSLESGSAVQEEFQTARKGLSLLKKREGWTEKRPALKTFSGTQAAYSVRDSEELWKEWQPAKDVDPAADLVLQARDRIESKDVDKIGWVLVLPLAPQPDLAAAVKSARAHLEERQRQLYPATTFEVIRENEVAQDRPAIIGEAPGQLLKFRVKNAQSRERFVVLAVVNQPEHVLAIQCECDWKRRSLWEGDFIQLLGTLSLRKE